MLRLKLYLCFWAILLLVGCQAAYKGSSVAATEAAVSLTVPTEVAVLPAPISACLAGGVLITDYLDANGNRQFDQGETIVTQTPICNGVAGNSGATGAQGVGSGITVAAAPIASCPAGGTVLDTFVDANNNGLFDLGERITSISTICNGTNGTNGTNGSNGANGGSAHLTESNASPQQCSAGGAVYTSFQDGDPSPQVTVVCNGTNGSSGANGSNGSNGTNAIFENGAVGPAVAGQSYSACHHDYLYIPDAAGGNRGWLTFRHQANGSADQGIGSTGFQVWNVDIADFSLGSEVGGVTYCNLHWNPTQKILTYSVVDNSNGLAGMSGTVQF